MNRMALLDDLVQAERDISRASRGFTGSTSSTGSSGSKMSSGYGDAQDALSEASGLVRRSIETVAGNSAPPPPT